MVARPLLHRIALALALTAALGSASAAPALAAGAPTAVPVPVAVTATSAGGASTCRAAFDDVPLRPEQRAELDARAGAWRALAAGRFTAAPGTAAWSAGPDQVGGLEIAAASMTPDRIQEISGDGRRAAEQDLVWAATTTGVVGDADLAALLAQGLIDRSARIRQLRGDPEGQPVAADVQSGWPDVTTDQLLALRSSLDRATGGTPPSTRQRIAALGVRDRGAEALLLVEAAEQGAVGSDLLRRWDEGGRAVVLAAHDLLAGDADPRTLAGVFDACVATVAKVQAAGADDAQSRESARLLLQVSLTDDGGVRTVTAGPTPDRAAEPTVEPAREPARKPVPEQTRKPGHEPTRQPIHRPAHEPAKKPAPVETRGPAPTATPQPSASPRASGPPAATAVPTPTPATSAASVAGARDTHASPRALPSAPSTAAAVPVPATTGPASAAGGAAELDPVATSSVSPIGALPIMPIVIGVMAVAGAAALIVGVGTVVMQLVRSRR